MRDKITRWIAVAIVWMILLIVLGVVVWLFIAILNAIAESLMWFLMLGVV